MFDAALLTEAEALLAAYRARGLKMATAESCTGGLVSALLTAVAGSSDVFERGFVTYSNEAKVEMLGVDPALIAAHGAVSEAVAVAMAEGALKHSRADVAVSITGVAGPGGGSAEKPVGTVWLGFAARCHQAKSKHCLFLGSRDHAREQALREALGCAFYVLNH